MPRGSVNRCAAEVPSSPRRVLVDASLTTGNSLRNYPLFGCIYHGMSVRLTATYPRRLGCFTVESRPRKAIRGLVPQRNTLARPAIIYMHTEPTSCPKPFSHRLRLSPPAAAID